MSDVWSLPRQAVLGGEVFPIRTDYRDILEVFSCLEDRTLPEVLRWQVALGFFYERDVPAALQDAAAAFLCDFLRGGAPEPRGGRKLLDWNTDAAAIVADVNRVCGGEVRSMPYVHWWTFLSWFHAIGEGQVSNLVTIRDKLVRGKKLESWEREFYSRNRAQVDMRPPETSAQRRERLALERALDAGKRES